MTLLEAMKAQAEIDMQAHLQAWPPSGACTIPSHEKTPPLDRVQIMQWLRDNPDSTSQQIAHGVGVSVRTLRNRIFRMVESGLLTRRKVDRAYFYRVAK